MNINKKRLIKDYDKLPEEIKEQIKLVFPEGYSQHLIEFTNSLNEKVSALPFETFDVVYLVRMSVRKAEQIIENDDDFDEEGNLRDEVRDKYEEEHSDVEYLEENENYEEY